MGKLPLQEKNAFLKVLVTTHGIYAHLAYSHYEIDRNYIISDFTPTSLDSQINDYFWKEYFTNLEKALGWDVLFSDNEYYRMLPFAQEGKGVSGIMVLVDWNVPAKDTIVSSMRLFCQDIQLKVIGESEYGNLYNLFAKKYNYKEVLVADINFDGITISRLKRISEVNKYAVQDLKNNSLLDGLERIDDSLGSVSSSKIVSKFGAYDFEMIFRAKPDKEVLLEMLENPKLLAIMSEEVSSEQIKNAWVNFVESERVFIEEPVMKDIFRAYFTLQLLSLSTANTDFFDGFGIQKYNEPPILGDYAVILTGNLFDIVKAQDLLLILLDGLQLRGNFDFYTDESKCITSFGTNVLMGINASEIILSRDVLFQNVIKVIVPEVPRDKQLRKVVFRGNITNLNTGKSNFFGLSPQLVSQALPVGKSIVELRFDRGAYVKDIGEAVNFISDQNNVSHKSVIVDCRYKPTVYGPDAKANKTRMAEWRE